MSGYNEIRGLRVKYLSDDPANPENGQVWYNSTTGNLRVQGIGVGAFSSGAPLSLARTSNSGINVGTQTAGLAFAGQTGALSTVVTNTEEYNGSGWSSGGSVNTARGNLAGTGTQTAGLFSSGNTGGPPIAGSLSSNVEEYNGSTWTEVNNVSTARADHAGAGPQTSTFIAGGVISTSAITSSTEEYDGTNWTSGGAMPAAREYFSGTGDSTNGLVCGGTPPSYRNTTFLYDGSSWTNGPNLNTGIQAHKTIGTVTDAITLGGATSSTPRVTATEKYDGTSWSSYPATMATGRTSAISAGGNSTAGLLAGGDDGSSAVGFTEELNFSSSTVTAAAWSSGGALPGSGRQGYGVGTGTQTASIIAGGPPDSTQNQFYNGSSWTNLASIPSGITNSQGFGDSEELLMAGGNVSAPYSASTYVYSRPGNSWTAVSAPGNLNTARAMGGGCGALSTAGIIAGGDTPGYTTATESWDGSTWTTVNALPTATGNGVGSCGTQTAGLIWSGQNPGDPTAEETYEWDGTNWTSGGSRSTGVRAVRGGAGTQTAALTFGGWLDPGGSTATEGYDGTAWSTRPNMAGAAANNFQTGTQTSALRAGGTDGPGYTAVEEFTGETVSPSPASNLSVS